MGRRTEVTMLVERQVEVSLPDGDHELCDRELELTVSGVMQGAEPDVGIMSSYAEDICAEDEHGDPVELTEQEEQTAAEKLSEAADDIYYDVGEDY